MNGDRPRGQAAAGAKFLPRPDLDRSRRFGCRSAMPWLALWLLAASPQVETEASVPCPQPFRQAHLRVSGVVGTGSTFEATYLRVGAGIGVFLLDGLELGVDGSVFLLDEPFAAQVSPGLRYFFHRVPVVHPYAGLVYRRIFVEGSPDSNVIGARAGAAWINRRLVWIAGGLSFERLLDCRGNGRDGPCFFLTPEIVLALRF